jgi:putative endonuclease
MKKIEIGSTGEYFACQYLIGNGYRIIERNYREKFDEIDIVALSRDSTLVFCEVKTFLGNFNSCESLTPEDNMTSFKIRKTKRACEMFVAKHQNFFNLRRGWRIDCAVVLIDNNFCDYKVTYYENI